MPHRIRRAAEWVRVRLAPSGQHRAPAQGAVAATRAHTPGRTTYPRPYPRLGGSPTGPPPAEHLIDGAVTRLVRPYVLAHLAEEVAV